MVKLRLKKGKWQAQDHTAAKGQSLMSLTQSCGFLKNSIQTLKVIELAGEGGGIFKNWSIVDLQCHVSFKSDRVLKKTTNCLSQEDLELLVQIGDALHSYFLAG